MKLYSIILCFMMVTLPTLVSAHGVGYGDIWPDNHWNRTIPTPAPTPYPTQPTYPYPQENTAEAYATATAENNGVVATATAHAVATAPDYYPYGNIPSYGYSNSPTPRTATGDVFYDYFPKELGDTDIWRFDPVYGYNPTPYQVMSYNNQPVSFISGNDSFYRFFPSASQNPSSYCMPTNWQTNLRWWSYRYLPQRTTEEPICRLRYKNQDFFYAPITQRAYTYNAPQYLSPNQLPAFNQVLKIKEVIKTTDDTYLRKVVVRAH